MTLSPHPSALIWLSFNGLFLAIKNVICQNSYDSPPIKWEQLETKWELQRSHLDDQRKDILPVCNGRRVWCTEDGSVWLWPAFSAGNIPLEKDNRFLLLFLYPLITKLMYCHTWLMALVGYRGPWSICEHFNPNMENCMSKYQRVMLWVLAFSAEGGYSFWAHIARNTSLQR